MSKTKVIEKAKFEDRYKALNKEQKKAVDEIDGPVMVLAGPGTGKTEILTLRIANIIKKTDTSPENILALTFTDSAATNMRKRLSKLIGAQSYSVAIETFHSFCNNVIKNYPEYFPTIIGSGNITEVESISILEGLVKNLPLSVLRPWGDQLYYIKDINRKIEELKREGIGPEEFLEIINKEEEVFKNRTDLYHEKGAYKGRMKNEFKDIERKIVKNKELQIIYKEYQEVLRKRRLYDWSDMIMEVLRALENTASEHQDLKLYLQENYQYFLVDEHQDTNNAQNKILELLCDFHKNPNIFIVGDDKQAIFRFQGASIENFNYLKKLYPDSKLIVLTENYRSKQSILDAVHSLMPESAILSSQDKKSTKETGIKIAQFLTKNYELHFVAKRIKDLITSGVPKEEIAIIYRSNKEAFPIADVLSREDIGHIVESDEDLLSEKFVRKFVTLSDAIFHYGEDEYFVPALHLDEFDIDPLEAYRLIHTANKEKKSLYDLVYSSPNENIRKFGNIIRELVKNSKTEHLSQFLEKILNETGILNSMIESRDASAFLGIEKLFGEGKRISENRPGATFSDFMEYLNTLREHTLFIKRPKYSIPKTMVRLMTAHKSKGLEFEYVFVIGATENSFGPKRMRDSLPLLPSVYMRKNDSKNKEDLNELQTTDDERRLFYVALTRAKKEVCITYPSFDENGKEILPSPFVLEIPSNKKEIIDVTAFEENLKSKPELLFTERKKTRVTDIDRNFVTELFQSYPLSVSALNNYLDCPWKYFYRNLIRVPSSPERHQIYGTAMHATIEDLWRVLKDRDVDSKFLADSYKRHLGMLGVLTDREFQEAIDKGTEALSGWFVWAKPKITNPIIPEFNVKGVILTDNIILSGKLDKVEMITDTKAIVTDYKTGKQKSRNYIEGKTKDSTGDMKRQLQFYKLLLKLHNGTEMKSGIIEFLEPNDAGNYNREEFEVSDDEVEELKQTIVRVADEIMSLDFWDKTCDKKDCEYCAYRRLLK